MDFPKRIEQHKHESDSFAVILYKLKEIGIFRNITESDYGIDFEIEVVNGNQVEGHCVKDAIKENISLFCEATIDHSRLSHQEKEDQKRQMKQSQEVYIQGVKDEMKGMRKLV